MFQLQMKGYMFKNTEYRTSLSQELGAKRGLPDGTNIEKECRDGVRMKYRIKVWYGGNGGNESKESSATSLDATVVTGRPG